jgi:hypothetical protein
MSRLYPTTSIETIVVSLRSMTPSTQRVLGSMRVALVLYGILFLP